MPLEESRLEKVWTDMYVGDGEANRPITVRLALMEEDMEKVDVRLEKISSGVTRLFWTLLAAGLALVVDLIVHKL